MSADDLPPRRPAPPLTRWQAIRGWSVLLGILAVVLVFVYAGLTAPPDEAPPPSVPAPAGVQPQGDAGAGGP